jgi:VWFA-related protein
MSTSKSRILAVILAALAWAPTQAQDAQAIKLNTDLVTVNVSVTDHKGRPRLGLKAADFLVTEEGRLVTLELFDSQGSASIVFVLDLSSSMQGEKWLRLKQGLKKFLATARQGNDYTLIAFSDSPRLIARAVSASELWQVFSGLKPYGHTALYDALLLGLQELERAPQRHRALVLLSDGQDNCSRAQLAEVQQAALTHRATIYTVGILLQPKDRSSFERPGRELLNPLAAATGGLVRFPVAWQLRAVLEAINADVSSQYCLGHYAPDGAPGWRSLEVNLAPGPGAFHLRYQPRYLLK